MLLLLGVKEGKSKLTLFCVAATSLRAPKKSMKMMKKTSMHMHVAMPSPRINKKSIDRWRRVSVSTVSLCNDKNITLFFYFPSKLHQVMLGLGGYSLGEISLI